MPINHHTGPLSHSLTKTSNRLWFQLLKCESFAAFLLYRLIFRTLASICNNLSYAGLGCLTSPISLTCMCLGCGRKPGYMEKTHAQTLHRGSPPPRGLNQEPHSYRPVQQEHPATAVIRPVSHGTTPESQLNQ